MNTRATQPLEPEAAPPPTNAVPASQPLVRWSVVLCGLGVVALLSGYVASRWGWRIFEDSPARRGESAVATLPEASGATAISSPRLDIDPYAPLPTTVDALVAETVTVAESLCDLFPESADALEMKARTLIWLGKYSDAVKTWEACLQLDPEYVHAYVGMASAAAARAEHDSAAQLAARVIELDPENFQARATRADALLQLGRADEVPAILEEYLAKDPRSLGFYYLGQAYTQLQQYDQAAKHFEAAVRIFPDYTEAYNGLAVAYERLGDVEQAAQAMEKFRELGSPERMAARIRGATESELVQMQRDAAVLYTDAGRVLYVGDRPDEAERLWLRATWLDPQNVPCRQSLAFLCRNAGRLGETIAWLKQLAELDPQPEIPSYWIEIGRTYQELAFLPAAEEAFRAAIAAAPASDAGYAGLADLLLRFERNVVETRELAQQAVDRRPSAANYAILAAACRANGDLASARTAIERAIELAPQHLAYRAVQDVIAAELQP